MEDQIDSMEEVEMGVYDEIIEKKPEDYEELDNEVDKELTEGSY